MKVTPIEVINNIYVKRDDLYEFAGVNGVKARTALRLIPSDAKGVVTAGVRNTSQGIVVAYIAKEKGIPCFVVTPTGAVTPEIVEMQKAGATVMQVKPGYKTVVNARARELAEELGFAFIPHSMETPDTVKAIAPQVGFIPDSIKRNINRIVVPCGSGMTMAGVLHGVEQFKLDVTVLGVGVGGKVEPRLDKFAPDNWRDYAEVVYSTYKYEHEAPNKLGNLTVDPIYEAKALPFLEEGDLYWVTGIRKTLEVI